MAEYFRLAVKCLHKTAHAAGNVWPEIKTEEIWAGYRGGIPGGWELPQKMRRSLEKIGPRAAARCAGRELALHYELALNPVYPMPHAERVLRSLVSGGIRLGIISNAQFYSPLLFNAFFGESPAEMGFCPELLIYSFEEGEAKPSPRLFNMARERLAEQNIKPEETLYIGNDMRNDIIPATEAGFKAALFAGDRRSLRLRKGDPACAERKPTVVIKGLETLVLDHLKTDNKNND
jgi:putative hydrolase of the HAD superfamily